MEHQQIKSLVEHHLIQLECGGIVPEGTILSTFYNIVRDVESNFGQIRLPRQGVARMHKKWLAFLIDDAVYLLDCVHWLAITGDNDEFLTIDARDMLCIYHSRKGSKNELTNSSDSIANTVNTNTTTPTTTTTVTTSPPRPLVSQSTYYPFSIAHFLKGLAEKNIPPISNPNHDRHIQSWCEYALIDVFFPQNVSEREKLCRKLLRYHDNYKDVDAINKMSSYWYATFDILYHLLVSHVKSNTNSATTLPDTLLLYECIHEIEFPMLKEFIAWELFLFTHCGNCSGDEMIDEMTTIMNAHFEWYMANADGHGLPLPLWFQYHLFEDNPRVFWLNETINSKGYWVRFEWLADLISAGGSGGDASVASSGEIMSTTKIIQGRVLLSESDFKTLFIPNLYKQTLLDTMRLLYMLRVKDEDAPLFSYSAPISNYFARNADCYKFYKRLPSTKNQRRLLYDYCVSYGLQHWPVTKRVIQLDEEREALDLSISSRVISRPPFREVCTREPDIEDLGKSLPPCLKSLVGVKHLNNDDRWTVIPYFIDMGYSEEVTIQKLSTGKAGDSIALQSQFKWQVKKNQEKKYDSCSVRCATLINLKPGTSHTITCPYEAEKRGPTAPRHGNYTDKEKREFTSKCGNTLKLDPRQGEYINHPIDYVHYKLDKLKLSVK